MASACFLHKKLYVVIILMTRAYEPCFISQEIYIAKNIRHICILIYSLLLFFFVNKKKKKRVKKNKRTNWTCLDFQFEAILTILILKNSQNTCLFQSFLMAYYKCFAMVKYNLFTIKHHFRFLFSHKPIILILKVFISNVSSKHIFSFQTTQNVSP